jgi:hypothetical protein
MMNKPNVRHSSFATRLSPFDSELIVHLYLFSGLIPFLKNVAVLKPEAVNLACDNRFGRDRSTKAAD